MAQAMELPANYTPSDKEEYMGEQQLAYFKKKLLDWREDLLRESSETLTHLKEESFNEPDVTDRATLETDTALELRTRDRYRKLINKIDAALGRIEKGDYGYCDVSGEPIGVKRLEARPIATMTIAAQEMHERKERQTRDEE